LDGYILVEVLVQALTFNDSAIRWIACKLASRLSPGVYWSGLSNLRLTDVPEPTLPGNEWVQLRTVLGGICGTDLGLIFQRNHPGSMLRAFASFPAVLGHESVAFVEKVGSKVEGWSPGTRVIVDPSLSCVVRGVTPVCASCQAGRESLCESFLDGGDLPPGAMIGLNRFTSGSWSPRFVAHQSQLHAVPDSIPDETAVLIDPIACALHGVLRHQPESNDRVLIQGAGIIGIGVMLSLRALGLTNSTCALVRHSHQADRMRAAGADEVIITPRSASLSDKYDRVAKAVGGRRVPGKFGNQIMLGGFDMVYDCVGSGQSLTDAMKFTRPDGTVVALGTSGISLVETTPLWFSELNLIGVYGRQTETIGSRRIHTYDLLIEWIQDGRIALDNLLTHTFPLTEYKKAFALLTGKSKSQVIKAAFRHF